MLRRRVDRNLRFHGGEREAGYALAETVVQDLVDRGVLDDARYTRAWLDTLQRRGLSRRAIRQKLRQKGVDGTLVDRLLAEHDAALREEEDQDPELERARAYCRRRRLGPWRHDPEKRAERREKDLAAMYRAGFSYGLAKACVDADPEEAEGWG